MSDNLTKYALLGTLGGGFCLLLWKLREGKYLGSISRNTQECLRKSSAMAVASMGLGSLPIFIARRLTWDNVKYLYSSILYANRYTTIITIVGVITLALFTVVYPAKEDRRIKYGLWATTCLTAGTALAPIVLTPRDLVTVASGYTLGLTLPMMVSCSIAPNFMLLNILSFLLTALSTAFTHQYGIPTVIARRHALAGTHPVIPSDIISSMLLGTVSLAALTLIVNTNLFVVEVERAHTKPESTAIIDLRDEINNGLIMAGYSLYVFVLLLVETMKKAKKLLERSSRRK